MIAALVNAGLMFDEPSWIDMAERAFDFVASAMTRGDRLGHSWRARPAQISRARVRLRRHDPRRARALRGDRASKPYLDQALAWQRALDRDYADAATGTYYLTAADAEGLVIRPASTADEATPNHNAVAAQNLIRLAVLAGDDRWREQADRLIAAIAPQAVENLYMHMALLNAVDLRLRAARDRGDRGGRRGAGPAGRGARLAAARPHRAARRIGARRCRRSTRRAKRSQPRSEAAGLRLHRRNLLAAGRRSGRPYCRHRCGATFLTLLLHCVAIRALWTHAGAQQGDPVMRYGLILAAALAARRPRPAPAPTTSGAAMPPATKRSSSAAIRASRTARTPSARAACASSIRNSRSRPSDLRWNPS